MKISQFAFNVAVAVYAVATTIYIRNQVKIMRNQLKINSNNQSMTSILNQRVRILEIAEKPRKKG